MEEKDKLSQEKLKEEATRLFNEMSSIDDRIMSAGEKAVHHTNITITLIEKAIELGYELGYKEFYVPMCEKCEYRNATCFGPGQFCNECSMEEGEEE
ncbi:MAG: hypothetical protein AABY15_06520 [Nanoarchaeota archaeon]